MAISGIGSYGGYNNYYQTLSQIRLQQALSKNQRFQKSIQAVEGASAVNSYTKSNAMDFLKSYSSTMSDVMQSSNALRDANSKSVLNDLQAVSSDTAVADVELRFPSAAGKDVELNVTQLAEAQVNTSAGINGSGKAASDMAFDITSGSKTVSVAVSALKEDGSTRTNREMLREAAKQINAGDSNVRAAVSEKDGIAVLELKSKSTGTDSAFTVSGELGAAGGAEQAATEAQNAVYSVTNQYGTQTHTSQSNKVNVDAGRVSAELKAAGSTTISFQPDQDKVVKAVSDLVASYNKAASFLEGNTSHGTGVSRQLSGFERALGDSRVMDRLGIGKAKDGSLTLDTAKLKKSLTEEPELTRELLSGSNGLAQTMFNRASSAMRTNSASLVSHDLQRIDQEAATNPLQFMSMYSRQGAYQMNNFTALGLMMNYLV